MSKKLLLIATLTVISFSTIAQDIIDTRIFLNEYKFHLSRIEYIAVSKVYLQSNPFNDEDHSGVKNYLVNNSSNLKSILSQNYIENQFDSLSEENNSISVDEAIHIKERNYLSYLENLPDDVSDIIEITNQIFDSLKTFEDYENPITKFMATEDIERRVVPKIENLLALIETVEKTMIYQHQKSKSSKLKIDYNEIDLSELMIENERLIKELESISSQWKNSSNYKGEIPYFQQFDKTQMEIEKQLDRINAHLFYHKYLENKKKISKDDFKDLIVAEPDTMFYNLREKIFCSISNIEEMVSQVKKSVKKVEQGADTSDPILAFMVAEARERQEYSFFNLKLNILELSNLLLDR